MSFQINAVFKFKKNKKVFEIKWMESKLMPVSLKLTWMKVSLWGIDIFFTVAACAV